MKVATVQSRILPFVQPQPEQKQNKQPFFREAFIQPFERLGFEKSFILISHTALTFIMGCLAGSTRNG